MMLPALLLLSALSLQVAGHGYLSSPPPRGIDKEKYSIDELKSPNKKGLCRGEPVGKITKVKAGQKLTLKFTITAPHVGPCKVTMLDANLQNESAPFAEKMDCAAPGGPGFWEVTLPANLNGHKVLRWQWEGQHITTPGEPYEQCVDLEFGGAAKPKKATKPKKTHKPKKGKKPAKKPKKGKKGKKGKKPKTSKPRHALEHPKSHKNAHAKKGKHANKGKHLGYKCTTNGAMKCVGKKSFATCANAKWVKQSCATGTHCKVTGTNTATCA
jgi:hypothetical protein